MVPDVVFDVLAELRGVPIDVISGDLSDVFGFVIHEDPDGVPLAMLLRLGGEFAALDHPVKG